MTILPTSNLILLRLRDFRHTPLVVLPENAEHLEPYGEVVAVGPQVKEIAAGDKIIFHVSAMTGIPHRGNMFYVIPEGSVIGKLVEETYTEANLTQHDKLR